MSIKSTELKNFRCVLYARLNCESLTAIVGANGCGKSSILRALDSFYSNSPNFKQEDFYNGYIAHDIEINITFTQLEEEASKLFEPFIDGRDWSMNCDRAG